MYVPKKYPISLLILVVLTLFVSACSSSLTTSGSSLSVGDVLQKSVDAMKQLKSSHVELQSSDNIQLLGPKSQSNGSTSANTDVKITGSGDQALPDAQQLQLTINGDTKLKQILKGDKVYIQNTAGKWYVMDKAVLSDYIGNPFAGSNLDQNTLLALIMHTKISDKGTGMLNGVSLRHITAELDKTAVRQLFADNPQLKNSLGQANVNAVLDNTKTFLSTIDVWINETNFYVYRSQLKLDLNADTSQVNTLKVSNVKVAFNTILDLSNFNQTVKITPPTNAIPTNDPTTILGLSNTQ